MLSNFCLQKWEHFKYCHFSTFLSVKGRPDPGIFFVEIYFGLGSDFSWGRIWQMIFFLESNPDRIKLIADPQLFAF